MVHQVGVPAEERDALGSRAGRYCRVAVGTSSGRQILTAASRPRSGLGCAECAQLNSSSRGCSS